MIAYLFLLEIFIEEHSCDHCEGPAAEEEGVLCFDDACFHCEVGDEGPEACYVSAVGEEGDAVDDEIAQMLMLSERLQHI